MHFTASAFAPRLILIMRYGSVSRYNSPSHHLHHKFVLSLPLHCYSQQAPSRCPLFLSREMAVFLSVTYHHITSFTNLSCVYLRFAPHSKRLHAAPYFCQGIWQCFSLQLTFTSPPSQVCLEFAFALLFTANALTLRLFHVKRFGNVSLYNIPSHNLHHKFVLSLPSHCFSQLTPSRCALLLSRDMAVFLSTTYLHITSITRLS